MFFFARLTFFFTIRLHRHELQAMTKTPAAATANTGPEYVILSYFSRVVYIY